jgi:catechol 2,3-dioxygenase-like lactoylglutathione lyase family enzyme
VSDERRTGRKPKRLYARIARFEQTETREAPSGSALRAFIAGFDRTGRLVAHGELTRPPGDLLIFRAEDRDQADRLLRTDPTRSIPGTVYDLLEWKAGDVGAGINLEPPPALGSGRLTLLRRVTVAVRDQAAAIQWYQDVLGLTVIARDEETQFVELALGKGTAAISLVAPRPEWGEPYYSETMSRMGTPTGISFETDSVTAFELRLRHAGARITAPPERQPWGERSLRFTDPDGNEFLAYEREGLKPPRPPGRPRSNPPPDEG